MTRAEIIAAMREEWLAQKLMCLDLEERSGVSVTCVYAWASGLRDPTIANLTAVLQVLGLRLVARPKGSASDSSPSEAVG